MNKREWNVDFYRIIATFFVIMLHVLGGGGILKNATPNGATYWVAWFMEILAYISVNCFALISGYIMLNKKIKLKSIIALWFQVFFYSILLSSLFFIFDPDTITLKNLIVSFLPIMGKQWWYISSYFALFFFLPILNQAIEHTSKKTFEKFLIVILISVCFLDCIIPIDPFVLNNGYSPIWLIILYLFGAYIKKYDLKQRITAPKSALFFGTMILLTFLSKVMIGLVTKTIFGKVRADDLFISYTSITIVLASIFLFLFCLNIRINNFSEKIIRVFAPTTLGVYLIHTHRLLFEHVIENAFIPLAQKPLMIMVAGVLIATFSIFLLCSAMDLIRIQFFKLIKLNKLSEIIDHKITGIILKFFKE